MSSVDTLEGAAETGDIKSLYRVIEQDPSVLEHVESKPFVETPLHIAADKGHLRFANEIMILKPSFALKLNLQGFTPLHVALQRGHRKIVHRLLDLNKELVRVQGRKGLTPLHLASQIGDVEHLIKFLKVCPDSIKDVTTRSETALHITARKGQYPALQALVRWVSSNGDLQLKRTILK